jgi:small-conductance mechanosensitive channel
VQIDISVALHTLQEMVQGVITALPRVAVALIIFLLFYFLSKAFKVLTSRAVRRTRASAQAALALGRLAQWSTVILGLLVALAIIFPSFEVGELVGILGISSVAIGFAFRDIVQNLLAGILLLLAEPFRIGDQIITNEHEGTIVNIDTRATTIKTYDSRLVVIPNSNLFTESVIVNTAFSKRRLEYDVGIGYKDNVEEARRSILDALQGIECVLEDPCPDVVLIDLADFSVRMRVRWWIEPSVRAAAVDSRDKVLTVIKNALTANGINFPFPTQRILLHDKVTAD